MTLNEIEQRLEALQAEKDKLTAELERLKAEQAQVKLWRAGENADYFYLNGSGYVMLGGDCRTDFDNRYFHVGNYYRTRELAEQDARELALRGRVRRLRDALCEGYQFTTGSTNYFVCYDTLTKWFFVSTSKIRRNVGDIYFDTKEHAQQACEILNA